MKARDVVAKLEALEPAALVESLDRCIARERQATAMIVAHLVVMERERIHIDMGYASLFSYLTDRLKDSRQRAYKRIRAARAAIFHPEILDDLASGALSLSSLTVLAKHLTGGQVGAELLSASRGRSKRQVEELVAARSPDTDSPRGECRAKPVAADLVKLELWVSNEVAEKLEAARNIDRHSNPTGDVDAILSEAFDLFVAHIEKKKFAAVDRPRPAAEKPTVTMPAAARRAVYERDQGRCTFAGSEQVYGERAFVEIDHVKARAVGGVHSEANGQLLCGAHNRRKAEIEMGRKRFDEARARAALDRDLLSALTGLGFSRAEARAGASAALARQGEDATLETLLVTALRSFEKTPAQVPG